MEEAISAAEMQAKLNEKFAADIAELKNELAEFKTTVFGRLEKAAPSPPQRREIPPPPSKQ
jgi:hypothetical protein